MITKEQLDKVRNSSGFPKHSEGELVSFLCDEIEALTAKPATPNPKAEKLRTIENLLVSYHPMRPDLKDAADEIDRLTLLLKERDSLIEKFRKEHEVILKYICSTRKESDVPDDVKKCIEQWTFDQNWPRLKWNLFPRHMLKT